MAVRYPNQRLFLGATNVSSWVGVPIKLLCSIILCLFYPIEIVWIYADKVCMLITSTKQLTVTHSCFILHQCNLSDLFLVTPLFVSVTSPVSSEFTQLPDDLPTECRESKTSHERVLNNTNVEILPKIRSVTFLEIDCIFPCPPLSFYSSEYPVANNFRSIRNRTYFLKMGSPN